MRAYRYLFYRLYHWASRWKWDTTPQFSAFIMTVVITGLNVLCLIEVVDLQVSVSFLKDVSRPALVLALTAFSVPQYFVLLHKSKYKGIVSDFSLESSYQRRNRGVIISVYVAVSLVLPTIVAIWHGTKLGTL